MPDSARPLRWRDARTLVYYAVPRDVLDTIVVALDDIVPQLAALHMSRVVAECLPALRQIRDALNAARNPDPSENPGALYPRHPTVTPPSMTDHDRARLTHLETLGELLATRNNIPWAPAKAPRDPDAPTAEEIAGTFRWIVDPLTGNRTQQFGYAPSTDGPPLDRGAPSTPPVPSAFGVGATVRRKGVASDSPLTVTRVGDGVVVATLVDAEGTRELAFYPNQLDLVTPAPKAL